MCGYKIHLQKNEDMPWYTECGKEYYRNEFYKRANTTVIKNVTCAACKKTRRYKKLKEQYTR